MSDTQDDITKPTKSITTADTANSSNPNGSTTQQLQQHSASVDGIGSSDKDEVGVNTARSVSAATLEGAVAATSEEDAAGNNSLSATPQTNQHMANPKEKTPMCLLNELARHNQINPRYELVEESGPAHQKSFKVALNINDHKYEAVGSSIKKAQHSVAKMALEQCGLPKPRPRNKSYLNGGFNDIVEDGSAPTVELNGLAMKLGMTPTYKHLEQHPMHRMQHQHQHQHPPPPPPHFMYNMYYPRPSPNYNYRGIYHQRYHYPRPPRTHYVSLMVGGREFFGEGSTRQLARHSAATKAIRILQCEPLLPQNTVQFQAQGKQIDGSGDAKIIDGANSIIDESKSEISLCYEIANRRELPINFEVVKESGLPHTKIFLMRCTLGQFVTEGEGNGKKESKRKAALRMLEKLKELPPLPIIQKPTRPKFKRKKSASLVKVNQPDGENSSPGINPISRLVQLQQAKKEKEPVFNLLLERGLVRKREFVMEVTVGQHTVKGFGNTKKLAKKSAAEKMLTQLGYRSSPPTSATANIPQPLLKSALKYAATTFTATTTATAASTTTTVTATTTTTNESSPQPKYVDEKSGAASSFNGRKVKFADSSTVAAKGDRSHGKRLAPGLLPMKALNRPAEAVTAAGQRDSPTPAVAVAPPVSPGTIATMARELLADGASPTAQALLVSGGGGGSSGGNGDGPPDKDAALSNPQQQLEYLSKILKMQPQFADFYPKNSENDKFVTSVTVPVSPPVVAHGVGESMEAAHLMATREVLRGLAKLAAGPISTEAAGATAAASTSTSTSPCSTAEVGEGEPAALPPPPPGVDTAIAAAGDNGEPAQENHVVIEEPVQSGAEGKTDKGNGGADLKLPPATSSLTPATSDTIADPDTTVAATATAEVVQAASSNTLMPKQ